MSEKEIQKTEESKKRIIFIYLLVILTFVVFFRSIGSDFVWDDHGLMNDPKVAGYGNFYHIFTQPFGEREGANRPELNFYRPLITLSYWANYQLFGPNPSACHVVNIALHVLVSIGVFILAQLLFKRFEISVFTSLLFAFHPSHVPSVSWVSGRTDLFCSLFLLLALILYAKGKTDSSKSYLKWLSLMAFVLALASKELACMYLAVVFVVDLHLAGWSLTKVLKKSNLPYYLSCAAILTAYLMIHSLVIGSSANSLIPDLSGRIPGILWNTCKYVRIFFFPVGLKGVYYTPNDIDTGTILLTLTIILLPILVTLFFRRSKAVLFGAIWVVIFLAPAVGVLRLNSYDVGDHLAYLPSMGVIIMTAGLLDLLLNKFFKGIEPGKVFISIAVVLAVLFSLETYRSTKVWLNENTLFTHLAEKSPSRVVFVRLGLVNMELQNTNKAQNAFLRAVEYEDKNWEAWYGLSVISRHRKDYIATLKYLNKAKRCDAVDMGAYALIFNDIGNVYYLKKDYARAKEFYLEAKSKDSTYREVVYNLANVCRLMGDEDEAAKYFELLKTLVMPAHGDQKSRMRMYMVK